MTPGGGAVPVSTVAPREIRDLVDRCCRVAGCDIGAAAAIAEHVTAAQIESGDGVERFLDAFAAGDLPTAHFPSPTRGDGPAAESPQLEQRRLAAHRDGVPLARNTLAALEERAAGFLVAEALLDQLARAD